MKVRFPTDSSNSGPDKKTGWWLAAVAAGVVALIGAWSLLPVETWIETGQAWFKSRGAWGAALFLLAYAVAVLLLVPGSSLSIAAGVIYGFWGMPLAIVGATIGACLAFLIARYVAHDKVESWLKGRRRTKAAIEAVNEGGWKIVGLVRLSPVIPFNLQNYFFGLTRISFHGYALASFFGMIPGTVVNIYLGTVGSLVLSESGREGVRWGFFAIGLLVTAAVTWFITRKAKRKLTEAGVDTSTDDDVSEGAQRSRS
jgi:uncharacterized membrane protein YdjX (TVP38/TMEM64 family)